MGPCGIEKHDFSRQLRQYIPGHDYVMVGNILGIWRRGTAARDNPIETLDRASDGARGDHLIRPQPERRRDRQPE